MAIGDIITATRYNAMQNRIAGIMGVGSGQTGYGQTLLSSTKAPGAVVTLADYNNLRLDFTKARQHQTGTSQLSTYPARTNDDDVKDADMVTFESTISQIENDKFLIAANQGTPEEPAGGISQRLTNWNGALIHRVTIDFGTANNARYFFNAGGEIRIRATLDNGASDPIYNDWVSMLTGMGIISMNHTRTASGGSGIGSSIGFYGLTNSNQLLFERRGGALAYQNNRYLVYARTDVSSNANGGARFLFIQCEIRDDKTGIVDEPVTGRLTNYVGQFRPTGNNVEVPSPTYVTTQSIA